MTSQATLVSYRQLLRFFIPLGAVPLLIASTHTMTDAALARLPSPELMLAAFAVIKGLTNGIKAPDLVALQLAVSLVDSRAALRSVTRFLTALCAALTFVLAVMAFTPAGEWALGHGIGLTDPETLAVAKGALPIMLLLPLVETLRNGVQGIAIALKRTNIMPFSTLARIGALALFLSWAVATERLSGVMAASITWVLGIGFEGLIILAYLVRQYGSMGQAAERMPSRQPAPPALPDIIRFFAPLAVMVALSAWLVPVVQTGLARSGSATQSLAAFGVAWGLAFLIVGPVSMLHQCTIVHVSGRSDPNWTRVMRFCVGVGVAAAAGLLLTALTPTGQAFLRHGIGVPEPVLELVIPTLAAFAFLPLVRAWREVYWGLLMLERRTSMIGVAKVANLAAVVALLFVAFGPAQAGARIPAAVIGALAYTAGEGVESLVIWAHAIRHERSVKAMAAGI